MQKEADGAQYGNTCCVAEVWQKKKARMSH
jgi:hypothetical protein